MTPHTGYNMCIRDRLYLLLYKPLSRFMHKRKDGVARTLEEAEATRTEADARCV